MNDRFLVLDGADAVQPPVLDYELQLRECFFSLLVLSVVRETITHDSYQHVEQVQQHNESHYDEKEKKDWSHLVVKIEVSVKVTKR